MSLHGYKKKHKPALWVEAFAPASATAADRRKRVPQVSARMARERRRDSAEVAKWKRGRSCECAGLRDGGGVLLCREQQHDCDDRHHKNGRLGPLLHDKTKWVAVCRAAHLWIQDHPKEARLLGLLTKGPWNT